MADILFFSLDKRRRQRPAPKGRPRGEIVIFHGVRIDRTPAEKRPAEPERARPSPGLGR